MVHRYVHRLRNIRNILYTKYLGVTNVCTTCGLLCLGDVVIQGLEATYNKFSKPTDKNPPLDVERVGRVFQVGLPSGLFSHAWYTNLDKLLPGKTRNVVFKKVFLDSVVAGPVFLTMYFYGMAKAEGKPHEESMKVLKEAFIPVYMADICYWPLVQAVNFYLVPSRYRILFISVFQLTWNSFLSFMKHCRSEKSEKSVEKVAFETDCPATEESTLLPNRQLQSLLK